MAYKVILSTEVSQAIDSIHDYITTVLLSPQSAKNTVAKILDGLKSLETFPEAGFDADEKIGLKINSKYPTRGKIIGQYILLYRSYSKNCFSFPLIPHKKRLCYLATKQK